MKDGIALAARYPHSGVVVRLQGKSVPFNPQAMTGGRLWVDDATVKTVARENAASRSRLSSPAQGIVPDEAQRSERIKEKTLGGD